MVILVHHLDQEAARQGLLVNSVKMVRETDVFIAWLCMLRTRIFSTLLIEGQLDTNKLQCGFRLCYRQGCRDNMFCQSVHSCRFTYHEAVRCHRQLGGFMAKD